MEYPNKYDGREIVGTCGCGRPLLAVYADGKRIGVTHESEDEDWHMEYFSGLRVLAYNGN